MAQKLPDKDYEFIRELITEMVHDRCFCERGSREFVEVDSIRAEPLSFPDKIPVSEIYAAEVGVRFSGELQTFPVVIKLLPKAAEVTNALELFQNEELFYSKIVAKIGTPNFAKCYAADMGRYGGPVIVLENLKVQGYREVERKLDEEHLKVWIKALGTFHGKGLKLKSENPSEFREFHAKLLEATFNEENIRTDMPNRNDILKTAPFRGLKYLKSLPQPDLEFVEKIETRLGRNPYEITRDLATEVSEFSTLCHGGLSRKNLLFKYDEQGKPIDVRIIDWQTTRYCPPGIDLGPIIFTNLDADDRLSKVNRLLDVYFDAVEAELPTVSRKDLRRDVVSKLLFAYNVASFHVPNVDKDLITLEQFVEGVCSLGGEDADQELALILLDLKALGTFD
ncbi:uncharacterized protein LOC124306209 [Neodiprion virginianus]|uniref:uncharacterized protein LOC124183222 n=1 Tax=Neodiprion fabricii TaxID=2872261 RepID=UPI001ED8C447|nr:uncharacterized protein LOC124183222 [Neodiprion fabricii]XP_046427370.1 uncharacterized protein LOC124183222 [Neodiprion fabricii]XP_046622559.1 uncharacterized protein LOC124306209 [Neodiprion virginianus]XP_046622560.1 uncharacterized protein LOC124306209 [Neodiprion virginianus]